MALHHKLKDSKSKIKSVVYKPTKHFGGLIAYLDILLPKHSAADGCLNAANACFSLDAKSGDFDVPENGMTGKPVKATGVVRLKVGWFVVGGQDKNNRDPEQH